MEKKLPERLTEEVAAFAVPRPLRLMFQDEARFGRISDVRHCWDKKPHRPMVRAMLTQQTPMPMVQSAHWMDDLIP